MMICVVQEEVIDEFIY